MTVKETGFEGLLEIFPSLYEDARGWFYESYNRNTYLENGIETKSSIPKYPFKLNELWGNILKLISITNIEMNIIFFKESLLL